MLRDMNKIEHTQRPKMAIVEKQVPRLGAEPVKAPATSTTLRFT